MTRIIVVYLFLFISVCGAGVKPLVVDIDAQPGDIREFKLTLSPSAKEEKIKLTFYKLKQLKDGGLDYELMEKGKQELMNWLIIDKQLITVYPGKEEKVICQVKIPFSAGGSNTIVVMVENAEEKEQKNGIQFAIRYAVRINIRVDRPGLNKKLEINKLVVESDENMKPLINSVVNNNSDWDYSTGIEATLRDENRKLVERLELKTKYQKNNNLEKQRIYPDTVLSFTAPITKILDPGKYNLRAFVKYGDRQKIINQEIEIKEGEYDFPTLEEIGYFTPSEKNIEIELKQGLRKTQKIMIQNELDKEYPTAVMYRDPENKYEYSVGNMIRLRSKNGMTMRKRGRQTFLFTMEAPKDAKAGSYHGTLILAALDDEKKKPLYQREVPVTLIVGSDFKYELATKSIVGQVQEKEQVISLNYTNNGSIFIKPSAELVITDKDGKFIERLNLNLPEGVESTLPLKDGILTGSAKKLKAGKYMTEMKFFNGSQELGELKKELVVEG